MVVLWQIQIKSQKRMELNDDGPVDKLAGNSLFLNEKKFCLEEKKCCLRKNEVKNQGFSD